MEADSFAAHRVHWFRTSATCNRWREEVLILEEEMRRCMRFFFYFWKKWQEAATDRERKGDPGAAGYARR